MKSKIKDALELIRQSRRTVAFTGAGISVESGIPSFRGKNGLWSRYDPECLDIAKFISDPLNSWINIKKIFYDFFSEAKPNSAHLALARMEKSGYLKAVITQNIDNLHIDAGSVNVIEYHGTRRTMKCMTCGLMHKSSDVDLKNLPPLCSKCNGVLKPDFIFFGETIPEAAGILSLKEAKLAEVMIIIGTTGEVMPAAMIPWILRNNGGKIIEINTEPSLYTRSVTDIFLQGKASDIMKKLMAGLVD